MIKTLSKIIALYAALTTSVPSLATSYKGSFEAIVTSGMFEENDDKCHCLMTSDLKGQIVNVNFAVATYDSFMMYGYPVPAGAYGLGSVGNSLFRIDVTGSSNPFDQGFPFIEQDASFVGNQYSGALSLSNSDVYDGGSGLDVTFSGAGPSDGAVSGTGDAGLYLNLSDGTDLQDTYTFLSFDLVSGSVQVVPEPASWSMMVMGFGAIGAVVRTRRRTAFANY